MSISLIDFLQQLTRSVPLLITVILTIGVILVNGWTDAPNAIATCVSTRSMSARSAVLMAAFFNFLGVLFMTMVNATVAETIYNIADFGSDPQQGAHRAVRRVVRDCQLAGAGVEIRYSNQRKPRADRRAVGGGRSPCTVVWTGLTARNGSRFSMGWSSRQSWASRLAGCA